MVRVNGALRLTSHNVMIYLWFAILLQPGDNTRGESIKAGHTDGGVKGLKQLVSYALEPKGNKVTTNTQDYMQSLS